MHMENTAIEEYGTKIFSKLQLLRIGFVYITRRTWHQMIFTPMMLVCVDC